MAKSNIGGYVIGNLYEAIKDCMKDYGICEECVEPTFDFQLEEFNGIYKECYYEDK